MALLPEKVDEFTEADIFHGQKRVLESETAAIHVPFAMISSEKGKHFGLKRALAERYALAWELWIRYCTAVDRFNVQFHCTPNIWGVEQRIRLTRRHQQMCFADDVEQICDPLLRIIYNDQNLEVKDLTHRTFVWTKDEETLFYQKSILHGKNFRKFVCFFPGKSVKDLVEFYYLRKFCPELRKARLCLLERKDSST
jgi:hypothetical protein